MTTHEVNNHQVLQSLSPLQMWNNITAAPIITEIPSEAYVVLQKLAAKWTDILDARDLSLEQLKGAMTNKVYACQWERDNGNRPRKVLVRVYGGASDLFFNRADEVLTFERMSQKNQGPRLLGRFPNGRVEEFLRARVSVSSLPFPRFGSIPVFLPGSHPSAFFYGPLGSWTWIPGPFGNLIRALKNLGPFFFHVLTCLALQCGKTQFLLPLTTYCKLRKQA